MSAKIEIRELEAGEYEAWESFVAAAPGGSGSHPMSTLRMGDSPTNSVCDYNNECWTVPRLYVCDASCLPNGLGGSNPARTINAFASRAAYYAMQKHFPAKWAGRVWPW